jgi:hypothetical protein
MADLHYVESQLVEIGKHTEGTCERLEEMGRQTEVTSIRLEEIEESLKKIRDKIPSSIDLLQLQKSVTEVRIGESAHLSNIQNRLENILDEIRKPKTFDTTPLHEIRNCLNEQTRTLNYMFFVLMIQLGFLCLFVWKIGDW